MKQILALAPLLLLFTKIHSQNPESVLEKVQQNYTAEKIYFHYDKAFYVAGETIWFKAYLVQGYTPSAKSTVLAVELLNDTGKMVDKKLLPVNGSAAIGEFSLPKNLPQGNYTVKAFTRDLMNFGFDAYYYHSLYINNPANPDSRSTKENSYMIHFFPEGGSIIGNVKNTIAFKCTDNYGAPKEVEGKIYDAAGKEQASFKSTHDGMGIVMLTAITGENYTAECTAEQQIKLIQPLPAVLSEGVMLTITREENKTFFNLDVTTVKDERLLPDYMLGVQENTVTFKVPVPASTRRLKGEIPVGQLPSGILQVTVFNKLHQPLVERLVFINSGDYVATANFNEEHVNVSPRGENKFSFDLTDTTAGTFSVSVTETDSENKQYDNIVSRLLLTSDIKGIVYNPAYYFEKNDELRQQQLDLVMLTNGWRRYTWNELLSNRFPAMSFKDPGYISVAGRAFNPSTDKPLANATLTIIAKTSDKKTDFLTVETDSTGNFLMDGMTFEDTASFIFQNNLTKNSRVNIGLSPHNLGILFPHLNTTLPKMMLRFPDENLKTKLNAQYSFNKLSKFNGIVLDEIKLNSKINSATEQYEKKYVSGSMGSMAEKTLDFLKEPTTSSQNIFQYLQSRLNGVDISGGPLNYSIVYRHAMSLGSGPIQMNVFLDEFQVSPSQIAMMRIQDVAMVKVFSSGGLSGGAGGTLAIYTKKGDGVFHGNGIEHEEFFVEGFSATKEFFSPNYATNNETTILNDERTTLYWNPYLLINAKNKTAHFSFYNSDKAKKFRIVIEGIQESGKLLHLEKIIE